MEETSFLIQKADHLLKQGELVVIPTETVYGLAADAMNPKALQKIFTLKGRPIDHPLIVHVHEHADLQEWACDIPDTAYHLIKAFWPGPLTLILKKQLGVPSIVTGGQESIGLRSPDHPLTQQLLVQFKGGLAAPSANRFGHISPTKAEHVIEEFKDKTPFIIDGGPCQMGVESTILSLIDEPTLLRPGSISIREIEEVLRHSILSQQKENTKKIKVSGALDSHYAPSTPLILGSLEQLSKEIETHLEEDVVLIYHSQKPILSHTRIQYLTLPRDDAKAYAHELYTTLRQADHYQAKTIFIEKPPNTIEWAAIQDRLSRAAQIQLGNKN